MDNLDLTIIILTCNRPKTMLRCLDQIDPNNNDTIFILDDSNEEEYANGRNLLKEREIYRNVYHIHFEKFYTEFVSLLPNINHSWIKRCHKRDISVLRNLELLIISTMNSRFSLLIDDDITEFNIEIIRKEFNNLITKNDFIITGVNMYGMDERSTIERLGLAFEKMESKYHITNENNPKEYFYYPKTKISNELSEVDYVSGGFLGIIKPNNYNFIAFPTGYNEDWIWCIENSRSQKAQVLLLPYYVKHDPPKVKSIDMDDFLFEILGDLINDLKSSEHISLHNNYCLELPEVNIVSEFLPIKAISRLDLYQNKYKNKILLKAGLKHVSTLKEVLLNKINWIAKLENWRKENCLKQKSFSEMFLEENMFSLKQIIKGMRLK